MISEAFQTEITLTICLLFPVSLLVWLFGSIFGVEGVILYLRYGRRYCKESDIGEWMENCSIACDGNYIKSLTTKVRSSLLLQCYDSTWVCWITTDLLTATQNQSLQQQKWIPSFPLADWLDLLKRKKDWGRWDRKKERELLFYESFCCWIILINKNKYRNYAYISSLSTFLLP